MPAPEMNQPMDQGQSQDQGAPAGAPPEAGQALSSMSKLGDAMNSLGASLEQAGAPKEILMQLKSAMDAYNQFLQMVGAGGPDQGDQGAQMSDANTAGAGKSVPADQAMNSGGRAAMKSY